MLVVFIEISKWMFGTREDIILLFLALNYHMAEVLVSIWDDILSDKHCQSEVCSEKSSQ